MEGKKKTKRYSKNQPNPVKKQDNEYGERWMP